MSAVWSGPVPIAASDQTWLHMDRPNNLMHVHSLMWTEQEPEWEAVTDLLQRRVVETFPVFSRVAVEEDGHWFWVEDPVFDLNRHLTRTTLPGASDLAELKAYVGSRFSAPFPDDRPLWTMEVIPGVTGLAEGPATVIFSRFHHALADGVRLVQLLLSLCETTSPEALPPDVGRPPSPGLLASGTEFVRRGMGDALDVARGVGSAALHLPRTLTHLGTHALEHGWDLVTHPGHLIDAVSGLASVHNQSVNTVAEVSRVLAAGRSVQTSWSGTPGVTKQVAWAGGLDLAAIKAVGAAHDATVNDVLLAVISRALTAYLEERGEPVDEIHWLVPVSLTPFDRNLPADLGNHFSLVFLPMPLGHTGDAELIGAIKARMTRLKESAEPVVTFGIQWVLAESPKAVAVALTNLFANKGVGVLTNVPGPRVPVSFAGVVVSGMIGWAPTSGDQPLSLSIFSYRGEVSIAVAADAGLVPDPERIADLVRREYAALTTP